MRQFIFVILFQAFVFAGCSASLPHASAPSAHVQEYRVKVGDAVLMKFAHYPKLEQTAIVKADSNIVAPGLGRIKVVGLRQREIQRLLQKKYLEFLPKPELQVAVLPTSELSVYFGGELRRPGKIPFRPGLSVIEGVRLAGGLKTEAEDYRIIIFRNKGRHGIKMFEFDLSRDRVLLDKKLHLDPYDVVIVTRRSKVAKSSGVEI